MKKENLKAYRVSIIITVVLSSITALMFFSNNHYENPDTVYQIYLDGEKIGLIDDRDELYELINEEQSEIKNNYNVEQVYPPNGFTIEKYTTYNPETTTVDNIYNKIKEEKNFTIKGYTVTVKSKDENTAPKYIYVLDRNVFEESITNFITTFVDSIQYQNYLDDTQPEIVDVGSIINNMYFDETITIKESYISVLEKIYTNVDDLTHYLLYGDESKVTSYKVKTGDTIESIAYDAKLNAQEFLIANPNIKSADAMLAVGQDVTIEIPSPQISLMYEQEVVEDQEIPFEPEVRYDYSKGSGYRHVEQEGVNGITRITKQIQLKNGVENEQAVIDKSKSIEIRPMQKEIVTVGRRVNYGTYVPITGSWAWPTNSPYVLTSPFGYRWGTLHEGLDISGTGKGSPIYAIGDGEVIDAGRGGMMGRNAGNCVVIRHSNGYYSAYAHLNSIEVKTGDIVSARQRIGTMGDTGYVTGVHLHLAIYVGVPYNGGYPIDPKRLWNLK